MTPDSHPARRRFLRLAAASAIAPILQSGCASRSPAVAAKPLEPLALIAVLPASLPVPESGAERSGFLPTPVHPVAPVPTPGRNYSPGAAVAAAGIGLLVAAAIIGKRESDRKEAEAIGRAMTAVEFSPTAYIDARLPQVLQQRQVKHVVVADTEAIDAIRAARVEAMPTGSDAVLRLTVDSVGYFSSSRAGGFSPFLQVTASLIRPGSAGVDPDEYFFYSDWRDGGTDRRWIKADPSLILPTVDAIKDNAATVRRGMEAILDRMIVLLGDDLQRRAAGQPRVG